MAHNRLRQSGLLFAGLFACGYLLNVVMSLLGGRTISYSFVSTVQLISLASVVLFLLSALSEKLRWIQPSVFLASSPIAIIPDPQNIYGLGYFIIGVVLLERAGFFGSRRKTKTIAILLFLLGIEAAAVFYSKRPLADAISPTFFIGAFGLFLWFLYKDRLVIFLKEPKPQLSLVDKGLSPAERTYILALIEGKTSKEISIDYDVSESTVRNTLSHAYKKLEVTDATELAVLAATHEVVA